MSIFTAIHVALSLVGILTGLVAVLPLIGGTQRPAWTTTFLVTTALTSLTGFGFPFDRLLPSHIVGALSLVILVVAAWAQYGRRQSATRRRVYAAAAAAALYFNVFVLVVQMFLKVPSLKALAPTQSEPPFAIAQAVVLAGFLVIGILAAVRWGRAAARPAEVSSLS